MPFLFSFPSHKEWDSIEELDQRQLHQNDSLGRPIPTTTIPHSFWKGYLERQQVREDSAITNGSNILNSWKHIFLLWNSLGISSAFPDWQSYEKKITT